MIQTAILYVISAIAFVLGVLVFVKSSYIRSARLSFFVSCLCLAVWSIGLAVFLSATDMATLDIASRWFYMAAAAFCPAIAIFIRQYFATDNLRPSAFVYGTGIITLLAMLYILMVPEFIIVHNADINLADVIINPWQYSLFAAFFIFFFLVAIAIGYRVWRRAGGIHKKQIFAYMAGLMIASLPGFIVDLLLPALGDYRYIWIGPAAVTMFLGVIVYSIVRYRMMDIKSAAARSLSYLLVLCTLAVVYVVSAYAISSVFLHQSASISFVDVAVALLLVFCFQPIKRFFDKMTDALFFYKECSYDEFNRGLSRILSHSADLELLIRRISSHIRHSFGDGRVVFCIPSRGVYGNTGRMRQNVITKDVEMIMNYYNQYHQFPEAIMLHNIKDAALAKLFRLHKTDAALPLIHQNEMVGIVFLGEQQGFRYSLRDIRMMEYVANELSASVQNAIVMEEIRDFNHTLQQKVRSATRELRSSNKQLQKLDQAKSEFISMASHQLRTPLTSIKGYLDMIIEGDLGKVTPTQKAVLKEAFSSSERMVRLINDFLNVSRLQTGKFVIDRQYDKLEDVLRQEVSLLKVVADQRNITLSTTIDKGLPRVLMDTEKIRQVILNMIDNAIYYSRPDTKVCISLKKRGKFIEFKVKDTGIGVPKSEQDGLFGKFFRASNAKKKRPDGTGVGLFLAKKVVLSHEGEIIFSSEEGKGSVFGFRLPITS